MKTPVTMDRLRHHFTYCWWMYALAIVLSIFAWNIIYSVTAYRPPEEKKIILGIYAYGEDVNAAPYLAQVQAEHLPEMEDISAMYIMPDAAYGAMILSTRIAARECDIYILPRAEFQNWAAQGAFMPLDEVLPALADDLAAAGVSLSRGWRTNEAEDVKHLYGIPCADLPAIRDLLRCDTSDMYISVFFETGNNDNVVAFTDLFVRDMLADPAADAAPAAQ